MHYRWFLLINFFRSSLSSVQSLSCIWHFVTPWTAACQVSLSITNSQSLLKLMSIESVMPSSHLILCCPLLLLPKSLPASGSFPMSQLFAGGDQSIGVSVSALVLPMNTQDWSPLGWTSWISLQSKRFSRVFSSTTVVWNSKNEKFKHISDISTYTYICIYRMCVKDDAL